MTGWQCKDIDEWYWYVMKRAIKTGGSREPWLPTCWNDWIKLKDSIYLVVKIKGIQNLVNRWKENNIEVVVVVKTKIILEIINFENL